MTVRFPEPIAPAATPSIREEAQMTNTGTLNRAIRIGLGLALISLVFVGPRTPFGYFGVIPLVTGLIGFCPLYRLLGLSTCATAKK